MLCEKCGRRQASWGTLCTECESLVADSQRRQELMRIVGRLKWFSLWMLSELVVVLALFEIVFRLCGVSGAWDVFHIAIIAAFVLLCALTVREWWLWRGYAARLQNGEFQQVAFDLLYHKKGFWKHTGHTYVSRRRRSAGIAGIYVYFCELQSLLSMTHALTAMAKTE